MAIFRRLGVVASVVVLAAGAHRVCAAEAAALTATAAATATAPAKASADEEVRALAAQYVTQHDTHSWQTMDGMMMRHWQERAAQLAKREPAAMQKAVREGVEPWDQLVLALGSAGGKENTAFLSDLVDGKVAVPEKVKKGLPFPPEWFLALALGRTNTPDAYPALRKLTEYKAAPGARDMPVAFQALDALARMGDEGSVPIFEKWLASNDPKVRQSAIGAAQFFKGHALRAALLKADPLVKDEKDRAALYLALVNAGDEMYLDKVLAMAQDESEFMSSANEKSPDPAMSVHRTNYTQFWALDALESLGNPKALPVLDKLAQSAQDERIRPRAAKVAVKIRKEMSPP